MDAIQCWYCGHDKEKGKKCPRCGRSDKKNETRCTFEVVGVPGVGYKARVLRLDALDEQATDRYLKSFGVNTEADGFTGWEALKELAKNMCNAGMMD